MTTLMSLGAKPKHYARATPKCMPRKQKKKPSQPTLQQLTNLPCVHTSALSPTQQRARLESEQLAMKREDAESWLYYLDRLQGEAMKRIKPTIPFHEDYKLESEQLAMKREDAESWLYYLDQLEGEAMNGMQKPMSSHKPFKPNSPFHEEYKPPLT